ncbi:hypothetical protein B0T20DRAFT_487862 [Sordaria brevicollis]|uniref:Ecp2 effector protein-like domain-containing protein n=1 Tax=Sordaria brevicollis TaxID=83679 RepID=A0AAE0U653_SORBR|nr:hypothetical protein B0T20DRAFT_487862 [Sordaria brevicollis]
MLSTNLRSILTFLAVAVTASANASPSLIGCVDVVDIKTGEVANCVPLSRIPHGQNTTQTKHQGGHARRTASHENNNLCVNLKYNTDSTTDTGPDPSRCVTFPVLRSLQASHQAHNKLYPRSDPDDITKPNEPCIEVYYLSPKDNTTATGSCIPITDLEKYQTVTLTYQSEADDDVNSHISERQQQQQQIPSLSTRDVSAGQNYTYCTKPYDIITHLSLNTSPHWSDCVWISANALGRGRGWTVSMTSQSHTLITAKTCQLAVRMTGVRYSPGTIIKIGNTDIEKTWEAGAKAINDLPESAPGKQKWVNYAQGFEIEGAWDCWDNTETKRYKVYFGYMLKGSNPAWWSGMGG